MGAMTRSPGLYDDDLVKIDNTARRLARAEYKLGQMGFHHPRYRELMKLYARHCARFQDVFAHRLWLIQNARIDNRRRRKVA